MSLLSVLYSVTAQFGEELRASRINAGFTLRKFAEKIEVSPTYQSAIERCELPPPSYEVINRIANALNESTDKWLNLAGPTRVLNAILARATSSNLASDQFRVILNYSPEELAKVPPAELDLFLADYSKTLKEGDS